MSYDLIVIGGGSGGVRMARWSAKLGAKVAIIERDRYGGTCVIRGCVPKKIMVIASHMGREIEAQKNFGWEIESARFRWETLHQNRETEVQRLSDIYARMLKEAGVEVLRGQARLLSQSEVQVGSQRIQGRHIVLATGARPVLPDIPGKELLLTSDHFFQQSSQAKTVALVGAGYIGVELAGIYHGLGTKTHLIGREDRVLNRFDRETARFLTERMKKRGIEMHLGESVVSASPCPEGVRLRLSSGGELEVECAIATVGRVPNTEDLGLNELGVSMTPEGRVQVDDDFQTSLKGVYALGDVSNRVHLTPLATAQGMLLAEKLFTDQKKEAFDTRCIPTAVFSDPPMATVGLTEEQCRRRQIEIQCFRAEFRPLKHSISKLDEKTFIKLIVEKATQKVLGCHLVGDDAPEILQGFAVAIKMGATKADFDGTLGIHPTSAEELVTLRS